jgi:hypothetical protein
MANFRKRIFDFAERGLACSDNSRLILTTDLYAQST